MKIDTKGDRFRFGILADVQYHDREADEGRYYRRSLELLNECVEQMNRQGVDFVVQLGDLINGGDDSSEQLERTLEVLGGLDRPLVHVLGNHDMNSLSHDEVMQRLGLETGWQSFEAGGVDFAVLDCLDVALVGWPTDTPNYQLAKEIFTSLLDSDAANAWEWNGAIGAEQKKWLHQRLQDTVRQGRQCIVFGHLPLAPVGEKHALWNAGEIAEILERSGAVPLYFCGHQHDGTYLQQNGTAYWTLPAVLESPEQGAWAVVEVSPDRFDIQGTGRVQSRTIERKQQ